MTRAIGLLGSGEFEPWASEVDRWLLERAEGDGRVLVLPTASAGEGDDVFDGWASRGLAHYEALDVLAEVVPIKTREDADRAEYVAMLDGASLVFFSGGNPANLAATLSGTAFWEELVRRMDHGLAYGGCSAGVACLGPMAPDSDAQTFDGHLWRPGLLLFDEVMFGPHWDALDVYRPGLRAFVEASLPSGWRLFSIDEHTAAVGDGVTWSTMGSGAAHVLSDGVWQDHPSGSTFEMSLSPAPVDRAETELSR